MADQQLAQLQSHIDTLLQHCERLADENRGLRNREKVLLQEKAKLSEKNELAKSRVEAMILRLKNLEKDA